MREAIQMYDPEELQSWYKPKELELVEQLRPRFRKACAALTSVLTGEMGLTRSSETHNLCRKRLRSMVRKAPKLAPDGKPYGYRVCVPWGTYHRDDSDAAPGLPREAGPHAIHRLLAAQPTIAGLVHAFTHALPPGRPPKAFDRLHSKVVAELKRQELHDYYPLNQEDRGRRALLRFLRNRRIVTAEMGNLDTEAPPASALVDIFLGTPFSRTETDAHRIDIETVLGVQMPNGGMVKRRITSLWLLAEVEIKSRAIVAWQLRVGRSYNNLDLAACIAKGLQPWSPRELTIPGLEYAPGAGLPSGVLGPASAWRTRSTAMDNAKAHYATDFEQAYCRAHGGFLIYGKAHQPRTRPVIEQLFSRLERGGLRDVPGGFEPATRLGDNKIRISNFAPGDYPVQLHLLEELLEVIIANYNATPHSALGDLTPLQFLQMQRPRAFDFMPDSGEDDAFDMGSVVVPLVVHGNRADGILPHVNYMYVRYRGPDLDDKWELIGKTVLARIGRHDLRHFVLMRSVTQPMCVVRAAAPWNRTRHDETTRALIMQWSKLRSDFSIVGVDCAIATYVSFLKSQAANSTQAVDQLARMEQQHFGTPPMPRAAQAAAPIRVPSGGWVNLDDEML